MWRPPPRERPPKGAEAATRTLSRVVELVLLVAVVAVAAYLAFTWALGPEVRTVLVWLLGLLRRGVGLASAAYAWVLEQLAELD